MRHETTDLSQIAKEVYQSCILSLCLSNLHEEYIMQNARLNEAQDGIKSAGFSSVQSLSHVRLFATLWTAAC